MHCDGAKCYHTLKELISKVFELDAILIKDDCHFSQIPGFWISPCGVRSIALGHSLDAEVITSIELGMDSGIARMFIGHLEYQSFGPVHSWIPPCSMQRFNAEIIMSMRHVSNIEAIQNDRTCRAAVLTLASFDSVDSRILRYVDYESTAHTEHVRRGGRV